MQSAEVERDERRKYSRVWTFEAYRRKCHSLDLWRDRRDLFPAAFQSGIDIGCGLGLIIPVWLSAGIDAWGVDLVADACLDDDVALAHGDRVTRACLWTYEPGRMFDVGVCTDVMEHIPEQFVAATFERIASYCRVVIFKIANFPSRALGEELHMTRKPAEWWESEIIAAMPNGRIERMPYRTNREEYVYRWRAGL